MTRAPIQTTQDKLRTRADSLKFDWSTENQCALLSLLAYALAQLLDRGQND